MDLFSEIRLGKHILRNRIVRSGTNDHMGNPDGSISDAQINLYENLAKNHIGMIISGHISVDSKCRADFNQPLATDDRYIEGLAKLSQTVHRYGGVLYGEISHAGLKGQPEPFNINKLSDEDIQTVIYQFADATVRLKQADFDGVEIHLAHGYFLSNVLDNTVNLRTDQYGQTPENRFRIVRSIITNIRQKCGEDFSILVKLNANNTALTSYDDTLLYYANELRRLNVDAIELSGNDFSQKKKEESAYYLREALLIKKHVDIPVILVGGLYDRKTMRDVLDQGIDMIAASRPFICEPDFARRLEVGQKEAACIRCFQCFKVFKTDYKNCVFLQPDKQLEDIFHKEKTQKGELQQ